MTVYLQSQEEENDQNVANATEPKIPNLNDGQIYPNDDEDNGVDDNIGQNTFRYNLSDDQDSTGTTLHSYRSLAQGVEQPTNQPRQNVTPNVYDFSKAICIKTSDRILDDLRSDPLFLLKDTDGILSVPTNNYSRQLSRLATTSRKYKPIFWNTSNSKMGSYRSKELDDDKTLAIFSGLLVPDLPTEEDFFNSKIFHYAIKIKYSNERINVKNTFYGFYDDQLFEDDILSIQPEDILKESDEISKHSLDILIKSLPEISDSANFISRETGTLIRLEVYPAILSSADLELFSITEIQTRIATYNSQTSTNTFENINLSPYDCFLKLKSALTGALKNPTDTIPKSIDLNTTKLHVIVDIQLLIDKFFFTTSDNNDHIFPVQISTLGDYEVVYEDYFKRAINEVVYYSAITSANKNDVSNLLSDSFHDVFKVLNDFDMDQQLKHWKTWNEQFYSEALILLSVCPFYNDQLINHIYDILTGFDQINQPLYFDALTYCATSRYSEELPYKIAILKDQGVLGFGELKSYFSKFGFGEITECEEMNDITDEQLLLSYKNQVIVASNKYEKTTFRDMLSKLAIYRSSNLLQEYLNTEPYFDIFDAYSQLDIDPSLDDSLLITFYDYKVSENGMNFDPNVARAFYTIALARKSIILMSYIDTNLPQFSVSDISLEHAYEVIGCMETAGDLMIIRIFQERLSKDTGTDFRMLWKSLKIIGEFRNSKLIEGYLTSGIVNSTLLAVDQSPAGLNNIGNTCYLNSLLQYYFVIEPLRDYILGYNEVFNSEEFESNEKYKTRRIGGRTVNIRETERSYQFMYQLRDLYYQLIHENDKCVTPSRELAYLAFSPISFEVEFEEEANCEIIGSKAIGPEKTSQQLLELTQDEYFEVEKHEPENQTDNDVVDLTTADDYEMVDAEPPVSGPICLDTSSTDDDNNTDDIQVIEAKKLIKPVHENKKTAAICKISADQFECAFDIGSQQDVTECISNVLIQIESAMKPDQLDETNEQLDMIKRLFYGKTKQRLVPVDKYKKEEIADGNVRTKVESFLNLIVNIGDHPKDIYDALDTYFTEDLLDLEDGEVKRSLTIIELPNILQIQIQRVQFDRERLIPVKSNEPIPFDEKLYMDRYLETDDETLINKRKEIFHWRRRVVELNRQKEEIMKTNEQGMTIRDVMKTTRDYLKSDLIAELGISIDMNTLEVLDLEIDRLDTEITNITNELNTLQRNISQQFQGFNKVGYSIFAIFIHRGQASYGHYFIYIRDPKSDVFRKYNDEEVSEVPIEEVFNFSKGNTATPYYLAFIKDELLDKITPLQRDILVNQSLEELNNTTAVDSTEHIDILNDDVD
jgi:ubiquitin carboxyl-terminal hydrolase 25/28